MSVQPPYLYDPVRTEGSRSPYKEFDPKAVTRASQTPKPRRQKPDGPLISFNQHPDSYLIVPHGNTNVAAMSPTVKKWVKWMRIVQLALRCFELLCAGGLLAMLIPIKGMDVSTGWIMRIVPGVAILHSTYGIYHLGRKATGRPPRSSASYMMFASLFDASIPPFYAFSALVAKTRSGSWTSMLSTGGITIFDKTIFLLSTVGAGLHFVSLIVSIYLAVTFHKIANMPPDMNPLEDNLTSRHKRNKSSISTAATMLSEKEKRLSAPLESKRSSGAAYEDLSRPPTIPFFHTRTQSTTSFSTYKSTPPPSRDARLDLPSRKYQIPPSNSARSSVASASELKRNSGNSFSPMKRSNPSYTVVPLTDYEANIENNDGPIRPSTRTSQKSAAWFASDSVSTLGSPQVRSKTPSPQKTPGRYAPLHQRHESTDEFSSYGLPNPLEANPPTPRHSLLPTPPSPVSPLSEISANMNNNNINTQAKDRKNYKNQTYQAYKGATEDRDIVDMSYEPEPAQPFKAKYYGDLKPGTPPIMIGGKKSRQVSSGNDFGDMSSGFRGRDVSGKIAEEGRGGGDRKSWGTRFRKTSGL